MKPYLVLLIVGDVIAAAVLTVIGFASHGPIGPETLPRMLTTFLPLLLAWALFSPLAGLFRFDIVANPRQLWRPVYISLLAAPFAALLRALMLNSVVLPIFALVLGANLALGMFLWRVIFILVQRRWSLVQ